MPAEDSDFWNNPEYCFFRPVGLCEHPETRAMESVIREIVHLRMGYND